MPDTPPIELTDAEREWLERSGMNPDRHAAIRDLPANWGGRSIADVQRAIDQTKETDR